MENLPINPVDGAVFAVLLLAALLAFTRGMVAEVMSVAAWGGAALISLYTLPFALPIAQKYIKVEMIAYAVSAVAVFVVALVVLSLVASQLSRGVQNSRLSAVDRSLGFLFGLVKGGVLVSVAYLFFTWLVPPAEQPQWLKDAKTQPLLTAGAGMIYEMVPAHMRTESLNQMGMARDATRQALEAKQALDRLSTPVPAGTAKTTGAPANDTGYKDRDRGDLERLIQNTR